MARRISTHSRRKCCSAGREPVYRQKWVTTGFAAGLFGIDAAQADRLSDDRIGRALDRLFDADRAALLTEVVLAVAQPFLEQMGLNFVPGPRPLQVLGGIPRIPGAGQRGGEQLVGRSRGRFQGGGRLTGGRVRPPM